MKSDEDVHMISAEVLVLFAKACEMFILELTIRSWCYSERSKRRTVRLPSCFLPSLLFPSRFLCILRMPCEMFILELKTRLWCYSERSKRRTVRFLLSSCPLILDSLFIFSLAFLQCSHIASNEIVLHHTPSFISCKPSSDLTSPSLPSSLPPSSCNGRTSRQPSPTPTSWTSW